MGASSSGCRLDVMAATAFSDEDLAGMAVLVGLVTVVLMALHPVLRLVALADLDVPMSSLHRTTGWRRATQSSYA
jgi:hypothetical protein